MKEVLIGAITVIIVFLIVIFSIGILADFSKEKQHKRDIELCILEGRCKVNQE